MSKYPADISIADIDRIKRGRSISFAGVGDERRLNQTPPKSVNDIKMALITMDNTYSAVFYSWIKNEDNLPAAISHFCKVANEYPLERIILVLKWIIIDWKLKSIIALVTNLTLNWTSEEDLGRLVRELADTWKPPYVAELAGAIMERWECADQTTSRQHKEKFLRAVMCKWDFSRITNFFFYFGARVEWEIKSSIFRWYHMAEQSSSKELSFADASFRQTFQTLAAIMPIKTPTSPRGITSFDQQRHASTNSNHSTISPTSPFHLT